MMICNKVRECRKLGKGLKCQYRLPYKDKRLPIVYYCSTLQEECMAVKYVHPTICEDGIGINVGIAMCSGGVVQLIDNTDKYNSTLGV